MRRMVAIRVPAFFWKSVLTSNQSLLQFQLDTLSVSDRHLAALQQTVWWQVPITQTGMMQKLCARIASGQAARSERPTHRLHRGHSFFLVKKTVTGIISIIIVVVVVIIILCLMV